MLTTTPHTQPFYGPVSGNTRVSWCQKRTSGLYGKGRSTEANTLTIRLGATKFGLTSAHLHHPPQLLQAGCPSCCPTNSVKALKATILFPTIFWIFMVQGRITEADEPAC